MPTLDWIWSYSLGSAVRGLVLSREAELLLARLDDRSLALLTSRGDLQARTRLDEITAATISDDGSTIVGVGASGQVWCFAPDLSIRREFAIAGPALAVATDQFGKYLAVADKQSKLHVIDHIGRKLAQFDCPRPLRHLAFVPSLPHLMAASDLGWGGCLDLAGGNWIWSDRPVSNIGSVAVAEDGNPALFGCFSEGVRRYGLGGNPRTTCTLPGPCGLVALTFAGDSGVAAGVAPQLYGFDARGETTLIQDLAKAPTAIALAALGDRVFIGDGDGMLRAVQLRTNKTA